MTWDVIGLVAVVVLWIVLNRIVFPRMGIG